MDAATIGALITGIAAIVSPVAVALTSVYQTKQNNKLMLYRIDQLENSVNALSKKYDRHEQHSIQLAKLDTRIGSCEDHIERLSRYHDN